MSFHALIAAAGSGYRFGAPLPKQYMLLRGKPVLQHAMERIAAAFPLAATYVVVAHDDQWFDEVIGEHPGVTVLRCGGATRGESIRNALAAMAGVVADDWVVVHDAVRPCVDRPSLLRLQAELADDAVGGLLAIPVASTLKRADAGTRVERTESRAGLWNAQTPQMFRYGVLHAALGRAGAENCTDEAHAIEGLGEKPRLVQGSGLNIKITYPDDLLLAEAILAAEQAS